MVVLNKAAFGRHWKRRVPERIEAAARDELGRQTERLIAEMRRRAPRDQLDLLASIKWKWSSTALAGSGKLAAVASAGDASTMIAGAGGYQFQNARIQEFGTANMPPNPYFYPTWRQYKRRMKSAVTRAVTKAIRSL